MDDIKKLLRMVFRTANEITFPVSGTGSAGMETAMANLIEEGDEVVVGVNGVFGTPDGRSRDAARREGASGRSRVGHGSSNPSRSKQALKAAKKPKLVAIVHAETSTGIHQPIEEISKLAHRTAR